MKAVILAAGRGTRLSSITTTIPKPMLSAGGRPVIDRVLEMVAQSGVREVFMNLHHRGEVLSDYCGDGERWGVGIAYAFEPKLLGTAGAVRNFGPQLGNALANGVGVVAAVDGSLGCGLDRLGNVEMRLADAQVDRVLQAAGQLENLTDA